MVKLTYENQNALCQSQGIKSEMTIKQFSRFYSSSYLSSDVAKIKAGEYSEPDCEFIAEAISIFGGYNNYIITSAYIDLMPIAHIDTRYFHYLLHAYDVMKVFYNMGNSVRQGLNFSEFSRLMVFEPTYDEQVAIADYLDAKVTEINAVIEMKKEQLSVIDNYKNQ